MKRLVMFLFITVMVLGVSMGGFPSSASAQITWSNETYTALAGASKSYPYYQSNQTTYAYSVSELPISAHKSVPRDGTGICAKGMSEITSSTMYVWGYACVPNDYDGEYAGGGGMASFSGDYSASLPMFQFTYSFLNNYGETNLSITDLISGKINNILLSGNGISYIPTTIGHDVRVEFSNIC
ncbi:MAG: hypothetical protein HZA16_09340 [Nitrospirae bacterium]|nr:hypothetical protein [Nitrospirota bacterium]